MSKKDFQANLGEAGVELWAGSEESYNQFLVNKEKAEQRRLMASAEVLLMADDWASKSDGEVEEHWLLQMVGEVAIITIKGTLICGSTSWWGWRDEVGYDDIRNASIAALNSGAKAIVYNFKSPGGAVVGVGACSDFISGVVSRVVPTYAYTDTLCQSGALWLAMACSNSYASSQAQLGSIGVLGLATEYTKMEQTLGVTRKVFKSTELKGYGNPYEKLSTNASKVIQDDVNESALKFINQVARGIGKSPEYVQQNLHNGKSWYGDQALTLGLVSKNLTIDQLLVELQEKLSQNTQQSTGALTSSVLNITSQQLSPETTAMATLLNAEAQASLDEALAKSAQALVASAATTNPTESADSGGEQGSQEQDQSSTTEEPVTKEANSSVLALVEQTNLLATQLASITGELSSAKLQIAQLTSERDSIKAAEGGLRAAAVHYIQWAFTCTGAPSPEAKTLEALSSPLLVAQYDLAKNMVTQRFSKAGQQSHSPVTSEDTAEEKILNAAAQDLDRVVALNLSKLKRNGS